MSIDCLKPTKENLADLKEANGKDTKAGFVLLNNGTTQYVNDTFINGLIGGNTGSGKTQSAVLPFLDQVIKKKESAIVMDPKDELLRSVHKSIDSEYQLFCINLRRPSYSMSGWDPLKAIRTLLKSDKPEERDMGYDMLNDLWDCVYSEDKTNDVFWPQSAKSFAKGLTLSLFKYADPEQMNIRSVSVMMQQSEERVPRLSGIAAKGLYDLLPYGSIAKTNLGTYACACNETRGSIHSVAVNSMSAFCESEGIMSLLCRDDLSILDLDVSKPFLIFIVLPLESSRYDQLGGILVSQLVKYLYAAAYRLGGSLPIRTNLILEEIGAVAKAIPDLDRYMATGRSCNIRTVLVVQSLAQIEHAYGKEKSEAIKDCINLTIGFTTNNSETLDYWSKMCGEMVMHVGHAAFMHNNVSPVQLQSMGVGTAVVFSRCGQRFITHFFPFGPPDLNFGKNDPAILVTPRVFDLKDFLVIKAEEAEEERRRKREEERKAHELAMAERFCSDSFPHKKLAEELFQPSLFHDRKETTEGTERLISTDELDEQIANLDIEINNSTEKKYKYHLRIDKTGDIEKTAFALADANESISYYTFKTRILPQLPFTVHARLKRQATGMLRAVRRNGGKANLIDIKTGEVIM